MGNRGPLLGASGQIERPWAHRRWIYCTLAEVNRRKVRLDDPICYTPLFFRDEAVALAAGHRPCARCLPQDYRCFVRAWKVAFGLEESSYIASASIDERLHRYRTATLELRGVMAAAADLPDYCFVTSGGNEISLLAGGSVRPWSQGLYGPPRPIQPSDLVWTITPAPTVAVLQAGYRPKAGLAR